MHPTAKITAFVLMSAVVAGLAFGQPTMTYPYLIVTPSWPAAQKDSVEVQEVLGTADNSCLVPDRFTNASAIITVGPAISNTPVYNVTVSYITVPIPARPCSFIYLPVVYGPVFKLGRLDAGVYNVIDQSTTAGAFDVSTVAFANAGSVVYHNATFTIATEKSVYYLADSISVHYTVTNNAMALQTYGPFGGNCEYDLIVALKGGPELYRLSTNALCDKVAVSLAVDPGATIANDFPKFVYPSAVDTIVVALDSVVLTVSAQLWGAVYDSTTASVDITVKRAPSAVAPARVGRTPAFSCFVSHGVLCMRVPTAQLVTVRTFTFDGRMVPGASVSRVPGEGSATIPLGEGIRAGGVFIVQVKGETFGENVRVVAGMGR